MCYCVNYLYLCTSLSLAYLLTSRNCFAEKVKITNKRLIVTLSSCTLKDSSICWLGLTTGLDWAWLQAWSSSGLHLQSVGAHSGMRTWGSQTSQLTRMTSLGPRGVEEATGRGHTPRPGREEQGELELSSGAGECPAPTPSLFRTSNSKLLSNFPKSLFKFRRSCWTW